VGHKTSVTPPHFIEVSVPSQESEHVVMYVCVRGINVASLCTIVLLDFGIVNIGWYCILRLLPLFIDNPIFHLNVNRSCFILFPVMI
jgi:hypothetical protein